MEMGWKWWVHLAVVSVILGTSYVLLIACLVNNWLFWKLCDTVNSSDEDDPEDDDPPACSEPEEENEETGMIPAASSSGGADGEEEPVVIDSLDNSMNNLNMDIRVVDRVRTVQPSADQRVLILNETRSMRRGPGLQYTFVQADVVVLVSSPPGERQSSSSSLSPGSLDQQQRPGGSGGYYGNKSPINYNEIDPPPSYDCFKPPEYSSLAPFKKSKRRGKKKK